MRSFKIYTDTHLLQENIPNATRFPLIDCLTTAKGLESNSDFEIVENPEECDVFLFPIAIEFLTRLGRKTDLDAFIDKANTSNKKVLVFTAGDVGLTLNFDNIIMMRLGGFKSKMKKDTLIMPPFIEDPYIKINGNFKTLEKEDKPTIGFVGHANGGVLKLVKEYLIYLKLFLLRIKNNKYIDHQSFYPSSFFRHKYLKFLEKGIHIKTNFIYRNQYRAGAKTEKDLEATTIEFYQNMNLSPYTFCMRGMGNFSVRFYETLAMGRIPVLIDTDCRLPFSESINWDEHCLIIEKKDVKNMSSKLLQFHQSFTEDNFNKIQVSNRLLWETYFTKYNFFIQVKQLLINDLK